MLHFLHSPFMQTLRPTLLFSSVKVLHLFQNQLSAGAPLYPTPHLRPAPEGSPAGMVTATLADHCGVPQDCLHLNQRRRHTVTRPGHKLTHFGPCTVLHFPPIFASLPEAQIHIHGTGEIRGSRKTAAGTNPCTGFPKSQGNAVGASCTTSNNSEHLLQD